ncbi:unnamed protein product [Rotaria sordida]|uniref:Uncharacterized protein n=1 Tax=Rotaria sordida TaxID=392033 RepID=A0A815DQI6_9BILA|nr:unnamed protein product [Rotaria sordida]CAF1574625.1 unnamed protein product [Rotaria sordida]
MTASTYHQQQHQNRFSTQSQTYASLLQTPTQRQQPPPKKDQNHIYLENILTSFSNKIEHRLQQFEERLISQVIEIEKKVDNIKNVANELETIIFETILPAIKAIQECSFVNTRSTSIREDLIKYKNEVSTLLTKRNNNHIDQIITKSSDKQTKNSTKTTTTTRQTSTTNSNDSE